MKPLSTRPPSTSDCSPHWSRAVFDHERLDAYQLDRASLREETTPEYRNPRSYEEAGAELKSDLWGDEVLEYQV